MRSPAVGGFLRLLRSTFSGKRLRRKPLALLSTRSSRSLIIESLFLSVMPPTL